MVCFQQHFHYLITMVAGPNSLSGCLFVSQINAHAIEQKNYLKLQKKHSKELKELCKKQLKKVTTQTETPRHKQLVHKRCIKIYYFGLCAAK